jgi:hypothetical protein
MCEFFIKPPPDTQRTERQGEREIWIAVCAISFEQPPSLPNPPHPAGHPFHLPVTVFIRIRRTRESPPPHTLTPMVKSEAAVAEIEDSL